MIKHFNTCDIYRHTEIQPYSKTKLQYFDELHSHCCYMLLDYIIEQTLFKYSSGNYDAVSCCIIDIRLHDLWPAVCADFARELIEKTDNLLFRDHYCIRDYIWILKQDDSEQDIRLAIIIFADGEIFSGLQIIHGAFQDILEQQDILKKFEIKIPSVPPEYYKTFISRHIAGSPNGLLLDCGLALNLENTGNNC